MRYELEVAEMLKRESRLLSGTARIVCTKIMIEHLNFKRNTWFSRSTSRPDEFQPTTWFSGYWLLHCHFVYHLATGMGNVFRVGSRSDVPPVPQGFPRCGNFLPKIARHNFNDWCSRPLASEKVTRCQSLYTSDLRLRYVSEYPYGDTLYGRTYWIPRFLLRDTRVERDCKLKVMYL